MAKIKKKHLLRIGFEQSDSIKEALLAVQHESLQRKGRESILQTLQVVLQDPEAFLNHQILAPVAKQLVPDAHTDNPDAPIFPELRTEPVPTQIYGGQGIERGAREQIEISAMLPIARATALMPDAHQGYGLPIGGVLATEGAIIPYAVGVDIGCRMSLSVFPIKANRLNGSHHAYENMLKAHTTFGAGRGPAEPMQAEVLEDPLFREIAIVKQLHGKAIKQIGSSGSGNHFVEFGEVEILDPDNEWGLPTGTYVGLLSHSGSRGLGAAIAQHYTQIAMDKTRLPKKAKQLAWLDLASSAGAEYWEAMNLAGRYASACHDHIHRRISRDLGEKPLFKVENHHNFAWKERLADGTEVLVHRKGATPAAKGELGMIPGSMTAPGFIVRGKGNPQSLGSASHGAGRLMSRSRAKQSITKHQMRKILKEHRVTLIGGAVDEAPIAYKDIHQVMAAQRDLVDVIGMFQPRIVRMATE
ncbi:RtcB family protein [Pontibacter sp. G13]|uniref:RtcB family protein n=1 Tax=Pontibacter sp. G13 TaxID=3074898 RepID=UPI00288A9546|nr:RtcB family protein [Pontibacter sp. G13]WNJ20685.1 RtcB family protein [Pontibacter sp. G13]